MNKENTSRFWLNILETSLWQMSTISQLRRFLQVPFWKESLWKSNLLPLVVGGSLFFVTIISWQALLAKEESDISLQTESVATRLKSELKEQMDERILALVRMAKRWEFQSNITKEQSIADAQMYIKHYKGYSAIGALDNKFRQQWIARVVKDTTAFESQFEIKDSLKLFLEISQNKQNINLTDAQLFNHKNNLIAYLPIYQSNKISGFLIAAFNTQEVFKSILKTNNLKYEINIIEGNEAIYSNKNRILINNQQLIKTENINLYGLALKLQVWPKSESLSQKVFCSPTVVLVAGTIISFLFAVTVYLAQAALAQKEKVEVTNLELKTKIRQRQQIEQTLRANEEQLRLALEAARMGTWDWDILANQVKYGVQLGPVFGLAPGQSHPTYEAFLNAVYPEDRDQVEQDIECALREDADYGFEFRVIWPDGTLHWVSNKGQVYRDATGAAVRVIGVAMDITSYKQTEQALKESQHFIKQIADSTPSLVYVYDLIEQRNIYTNREIAPSLGYTSEQIIEMGAALFQNIMHPEDFALVPERNQRFETAKDGEMIETIFRMKNAKGEWRWLYSRDTVFNRTTNGKPRQILGACQDITELKNTEAALQEANEKLIIWVNELKLRNHEITLLAKMSEFLQACQTVEEAYDAIAQFIQQLFPEVSGGIFTISESKNLVEAVITWGTIIASHKLFSPCECWALRRGGLHLVADYHNALLCKHHYQHTSPIQSLCVPMIAQGEALGLLQLSTDNTSALTEAKQQLAVTVAEHISLALANLKLREKLRHQSIRDPLTGLFNRRYMEESLEREINRTLRRQQSLGIIMLDVDHFKKFNDTYGHDAGDAVLRAIGLFLQQQIRGSDIACRYGGEELMLILPEAFLEETKQRAEQLREGVKHLNLQHQNQSLGIVTLSIGVACLPENGVTGEAIIRAADAALYKAKKAGRDRVIVAS